MRGSKNTSGLLKEIKASYNFHSGDVIPLIASSALLRSRNLGQIDLARLVKRRGEWILEIAEVKSSPMGEENFFCGQRQRQLGGLHFLSGILGVQSKLSVIVG